MAETTFQKFKQMLRRLFPWWRKEEPGEATPGGAPSGERPSAPARPATPEVPKPPDAPTLTPVQAVVADEKVDQLIKAMDAPRQQLEILLREFAALPEKADKLLAAGQSQAESTGKVHGALTELKSRAEQNLAALAEQTQKQVESADRIREAVAAIGTDTQQGLATLNEHGERQMELAAGIRDAVAEMRTQNEQGLDVLSQRAQKHTELLVKIEQALEAAREPQAKMLATLDGMSTKLEDASRSSAAQAQEVRQMGQSLTKATTELSESMKTGSQRVTKLLLGILAALALLVLAALIGIFV